MSASDTYVETLIQKDSQLWLWCTSDVLQAKGKAVASPLMKYCNAPTGGAAPARDASRI